MGRHAEGPSAYPKPKAMFEKQKARIGSEIANVNRAPGMLKLKCRCHDSRDGHIVAFRRQVAQFGLGRITALPAWNGPAVKTNCRNHGEPQPLASLLRNRC